MKRQLKLWQLLTISLVCSVGPISALADVSGIKIVKDEAITIGGKPVHHIVGVASGKALRSEPTIPTLDHVAGLAYETEFDLWIPSDGGNGRFWFSVLNRGNEAGAIRDAVLARGGIYSSCAWQAKGVKESKPQLKLSGYEGPAPQAYGLVVVRDFVSFLRYAPTSDAAPNPLAGKIHFAFTTGISQSGRFIRTFLLLGLNKSPQGKVFDGALPIGARAGYIDLFRPDADPGSGGTFTPETVHAPYSWTKLMAENAADAKVFALNAESEYYVMMAYMSRRGAIPNNVRLYEFPLGGHGGGGAVPWRVCIAPLSLALEDWACNGTTPPDSQLLELQAGENARVKHAAGETVDSPVLDDLGIAKGGVRLPEVDVPTARYAPSKDGNYKAEPLTKDELKSRYGTPAKYRKQVAEAVDWLIRQRFLPESSREKYAAEAAKVDF